MCTLNTKNNGLNARKPAHLLFLLFLINFPCRRAYYYEVYINQWGLLPLMSNSINLDDRLNLFPDTMLIDPIEFFPDQ